MTARPQSTLRRSRLKHLKDPPDSQRFSPNDQMDSKREPEDSSHSPATPLSLRLTWFNSCFLCQHI